MKRNLYIHQRMGIILCIISIVIAISGCETNNQKPHSTPQTTSMQATTLASGTEPADPPDKEISWDMDGTLLLADGTVAGSVHLTVQGTIQAQENKSALLVLDITLPSYFRYFYKMPNNEGYLSINRQYDGLNYYVCHTYVYDRKENEPAFSGFAVDPEKEFVIFHWDDGSGHFLVASANPDSTPQDVLDHFKDFVELYSFDLQ